MRFFDDQTGEILVSCNQNVYILNNSYIKNRVIVWIPNFK